MHTSAIDDFRSGPCASLRMRSSCEITMRILRILKKLARIFTRLMLLGVAGIGLLLALFWIEHKFAVTLPKPTGPYAVGRVEYNWVDSNRIDSLAPTSGIKRELPIWIWYPADSDEAGRHPTVKYFPERLLTAQNNLQGVLMSDFFTRDLSLVSPHAIQNASLSPKQARYPVVLFKPGIGALSLDYSTLCEDLASHGYIVVASDSPYSTFVVVFNDGRVVTRSHAGHIDEGTGPAEAKRLGENIIQVWSADLRFELDQLEQIDKKDQANLFTGRLNLDEIGVFGHSFGGATAAQFCHDDPRCRAGIDIDGQPFGNVVQAGLNKPFLYLLSDHGKDSDPESQEIRHRIQNITKGLPNWPNQITVIGTHHFSFSDQALLKERFIMKLLGHIDERRALSITAEYVRAFFDTNLKNTPDVLMNGPSGRYQEIKIEPK
jgi:predicted dienelactone hydrolase